VSSVVRILAASHACADDADKIGWTVRGLHHRARSLACGGSRWDSHLQSYAALRPEEDVCSRLQICELPDEGCG